MTVTASIAHRESPIALIAADIKLAHSVFALPFAVLAAFMAADRILEAADADPVPGVFLILQFGGRLALIVLAMVLARTVAMLANRLIDRDIDGRNPRTAGRALPSGRLAASHALLTLLVSSLLFVGVCATFGWAYENLWPLILALPVLIWISAYGYLKRFTALCHIYLGSSLALGTIAAAVAVDPAALSTQPSLWLLSGMVLCWVAGFDVIYALQDVEVDRAQGLHSMPARLGVSRAMWIARLLHAVALGCLVGCLAFDERLGTLFGAGVAIVGGLLVFEHLTVSRWGTTRMALAFFTLNGAISGVLGLLGVVDVLI